MASESTEDRSVALDLPATLDEWLTERAAEMGVERDELLVQLVSSYQVATESENGETVEAFETTLEDGTVDIEEAVEEAVAAAVPGDREIAEQVDQRIDGRLDSLEADIEDKLDDIRRRVVQVKQTADGKAPADHEHEAFDRLDELERQVSGLRDQVAELEEAAAEGGTADGELREDLSEVESKLTQLARIVVELRDDRDQGPDEDETVLADIKRTAAREGFESAECGACGGAVSIGLLTEPACPHCDNDLGGVVPGSGGLFGSKARLTGRNAPDGDGSPAAEASDDE